MKAKRLLKRKVFRHAAQADPIPAAARRELAHRCLQHGATATRQQLTALAQAKIAFGELYASSSETRDELQLLQG